MSVPVSVPVGASSHQAGLLMAQGGSKGGPGQVAKGGQGRSEEDQAVCPRHVNAPGAARILRRRFIIQPGHMSPTGGAGDNRIKPCAWRARPCRAVRAEPWGQSHNESRGRALSRIDMWYLTMIGPRCRPANLRGLCRRGPSGGSPWSVRGAASVGPAKRDAVPPQHRGVRPRGTAWVSWGPPGVTPVPCRPKPAGMT